MEGEGESPPKVHHSAVAKTGQKARVRSLNDFQVEGRGINVATATKPSPLPAIADPPSPSAHRLPALSVKARIEPEHAKQKKAPTSYGF